MSTPKEAYAFVQLAHYFRNLRGQRSSTGPHAMCCFRFELLHLRWSQEALSKLFQGHTANLYMYMFDLVRPAADVIRDFTALLLLFTPSNVDRMHCRYDAIVIGVGGMGSAALYQLAKRGTKVTSHALNSIAHCLLANWA